MLSQYDRQQLELIANRLRMDDPDLVKALREGKPRPMPTNRRWPYFMLAALASLVLLAGVLVGAFVFIFAGAVSITLIVLAYRRFVPRQPRVRTSRRRPS